MAQERNKGQAGMGGRGKNQPKNRQDVATPRKRKMPALATVDVPGSPSGTSARRNQKRNQREWHGDRRRQVKKAAGIK
jgi:hypothetical protein